MDRVDELRTIVKDLIRKYAQIPASYGDVVAEPVYDDAGGHYQLWHIGWQQKKRVHGCILNIQLKDGKLWIQHDGIEHGVTDELLEAGVQPEELVLAFFTTAERKHLPFAIA